ncbi:MAG: hypothetical protein F6K32_24160, partial [Desertifilum sp. SIO1I2]|nr:hypothetical protein [Desertifilum sp. SIO1I2]
NDYLVSGLDRDTLTGGEGTNRFVYIQDVIDYNATARDALGAVDATPTVSERIARADRITDFSTTDGDIIRVQGAGFGGIDITGQTNFTITAGAAGIGTGLDFGDGAAATLTAAQAANREQLQEFLQGSVRAIVADAALATQWGVAQNSVIVYIEQDVSLITGTGTATDPFDPQGVTITGTGTTTTPYAITGAVGVGLTAGDTVLAVLQPGDVPADFATAFTQRGAANFELFA